jgi:hypothetical protein
VLVAFTYLWGDPSGGLTQLNFESSFSYSLITNCLFENSDCDIALGGGLKLIGSTGTSILIENCAFTNIQDGSGGEIYAINSSKN